MGFIKMRILKTYEGFSMQGNCERCHKSSGGVTTMSIFNSEVICMSCKEKEKKDPEYLAASLEELESVRAGDMNFSGAIPDYKPIK
jgi:hypothetical protein